MRSSVVDHAGRGGMAVPSPLTARLRNAIWEAGLLCVLPLAFWRGFSEQFTTPKLFLAQALLTGGLGVWGIGQIWRPQIPRHSLRVPLLAFSFAVPEPVYFHPPVALAVACHKGMS